MSLGRLRQFWRENGAYVFGTNIVGTTAAFVRNYMISRKLGVKKLKIGPLSHLRGLSSIDMGEDFAAGTGLWLEAILRFNDQNFSPKIVIGNSVRISHFTHITATHRVEIGDNVLMGSKVMITDHGHGQYSRDGHSSPRVAPSLRLLDNDQQVVIGPNVWLGDGVFVTPGSSIGEGSVIGANSVVRGNIPPFSIAVGAPARVRKTYNFDTEKWSNIE